MDAWREDNSKGDPRERANGMWKMVLWLTYVKERGKEYERKRQKRKEENGGEESLRVWEILILWWERNFDILMKN